MFLDLFNNPDISVMRACCSCTCGCHCEPTSAEYNGQRSAASSVARSGSSTNSTPSA